MSKDIQRTIQRRFLPASIAPVKIQKRADGAQVIAGYAAVFYNPGDPGTQYELWPNVYERVLPGAFDRAVREQDDARGLFNHDPDNLLGRVSSGTMKLSVDQRGLLYEIAIDPEDPDHKRVMRKIERGDLTGSSFSFIAEQQSWHENADNDVRQLRSVRLIDAGPVTYPAYEASTTGLRAEGNIEEVKASLATWKAEQRRAAMVQTPVLPM